MPIDKELWFDFGPSKKLTKTGFKKHFGHLQFDSALQYVAFPQNTLDKGEDSRHVLRQGRTVSTVNNAAQRLYSGF